jgi:hypothetical protein
MKYIVFEECDCHGKPFNYDIGFSVLFWWVTIPAMGYSTREAAQKRCDQLNGYKRPV